MHRCGRYTAPPDLSEPRPNRTRAQRLLRQVNVLLTGKPKLSRDRRIWRIRNRFGGFGEAETRRIAPIAILYPAVVVAASIVATGSRPPPEPDEFAEPPWLPAL